MREIKLVDGSIYNPISVRQVIKEYVIKKGAVTIDDMTNFVWPLQREKIDIQVELTEEDKDQGCIAKTFSVYKYTNESLSYALKDLVELGEIIELCYNKPGIQYKKRSVYFAPDSHFVFTKPGEA